jgi:hypothetical protein
MQHVGETRIAYKILVGRPECKWPLGKSRYKWESIEMDFNGIGWDGMDYIHLARPVVGSCEHGNGLSRAKNDRKILDSLNVCGSVTLHACYVGHSPLSGVHLIYTSDWD